MRVVAGSLGGRVIEAPKGHRTHPMSERVRGGLFNALGDITGLSVLDAFAGSGALSIEAISRGAAGSIAVDLDKKAYETLVKNIKNLGLSGKIKAVKANVGSWSDTSQDRQFDLVFVAPPYDDLQTSLVQKLVKHVKLDGLYVLDWPGALEAPVLESLRQLKQLNYGDAQLVFYRKTA